MPQLSEFLSNDVVIGGIYKRYLDCKIDQKDMDFYIMLKGLLHRADHSASAGVDIIATELNYNRKSITNRMIGSFPDPWQLDSLTGNYDQNIILEAGTGMGKTEFALCWAAGSRTYYVLPLRSSVNAMYKRVVGDTFMPPLKDVGLLHSSALNYFVDEDKTDTGITDALDKINLMRQLSLPITISTADQIFPAVFSYPGYERIYASMACSKIVIDEIQSYDPAIAAAILHGISDFARLGAKICIITATLPSICFDYLHKNLKIKRLNPKYKDIPRHKIHLVNDTIDSSQIIDIIDSCTKNPEHKILVIVNTIKTAQKLKSKLEQNNIGASLLHSRFTQEDRARKESDKNGGIMDTGTRGVWISTQIVEASVNIDFDVLITEVSTMDSQIQRWGRIWRNRDNSPYDKDPPNIYVATKQESGIYDTEITENTIDVLESNLDKTKSDRDAYDMFNCVFSSQALIDTKYKTTFDSSVEKLDVLEYTAETKSIAQKLFRDISNIDVIPQSIYESNKDHINKLKDDLHVSKSKRLAALFELKKKTVSTRQSKSLKLQSLDEKYNIKIATADYSFEYGLIID